MLLLFSFLFLFLLITNIKSDNDRCLKELDPGPCKYYQSKWYWDSKTERCNEFHYGGCLGNDNRFNTKQECLKQCVFKEQNPAIIPDVCLLEADPGYCNDERNGQWWYFFNSNTGVCEQFFYYGCGGNYNKFYSLYQCRKVCGERLSPQIACDKCDVRTSICKQNSKFNYTCECRPGFKKNVYSECEDIDECRQGLSNCGNSAWCTNTIGSYKCECMSGYIGDGFKCTYVGIGKSSDDCSKCSKDATCKNGVCQCKLGFTGDGFDCVDVNECLRHPNVCDQNAVCKNTEGSYICECKQGFAGNGHNCTQEIRSCLDKFNRDYEESCGSEHWREYYFFDHKSKRCSLFWYDNCQGRSMNIFNELSTCENMCEKTNILIRSEICWDKFDPNYKNQCLSGEWQQRYYFDQASLTCRLFWYDECQGNSRNMFDDLLTCQWLCEEQPRYNSRTCLESFDEHYRDECNGGKWRQQYYYDKSKKKCIAFWYDGCTSESQNIFADEMACVSTCETPAKIADEQDTLSNRNNYYDNKYSGEIETFETDYRIDSNERRKNVNKIKDDSKKINPHRLRHHHNDYKSRQRLKHLNDEMNNSTAIKDSTNNICEINNPCQNNGTCIYDIFKNMYFCKCAFGFTNDNCTERIDADPCSSDPCKNGGTCAAKASTSKTSYECICLPEYGGINCESRPCDDEPCKNNGTCRTTRSSPAFFCDCIDYWGGKHCEIPIPKPKTKYGKNVKLVSSGQPEWIEELKRRKIQSSIERKPIRTAKDKNKIKLNDESSESISDNDIATSAELIAAVNETDPQNINDFLQAGQTGGEMKSNDSNEICFSLITVLFLFYIY